MATAVSPHRAGSDPERIVLYDVGWRVYDLLLDAIGERNIRLTYSDGNLEIMTLSLEHESWKKIIAGLIEILSIELNIPMRRVGALTCRREEFDKGLEPDESYYVQHEAQIRGKREIDLGVDPPPDLAIEVDISYREIRRERIYAALGVPELWRFDGQRLHFLHLTSTQNYEPMETSLAFPALRVADIQRFLKLDPAKDETSLMREFRDWVRAALLPDGHGRSNA